MYHLISIPNFISLLVKLTLILAIGTGTANARTNVTIDDQSPVIVYAPQGSWARIADSSTQQFDFDGSHMLTSDPSATATFTFTGVAVYFLSARWPYNVSTTVTLDTGDPVILDLVDHTRPAASGGPATVKSEVVASAVGLMNGSHTITVGVGQGQLFGLVDGFIYTSLSPDDTVPITTTPPPTQFTPVAPSTTTSATSTTPHKKSHALAIGLSIFFVLLFLVLLILVYLFFRRHRRQQKEEERYANAVPTAYTDTAGSVLSANGAPRTMRNAYAQEFPGHMNLAGEDGNEKVVGNPARKSQSLHVTNPDPSTTNLNEDGSPRIAMPAPAHAAHDYVPNGSSSASAAAAAYAARLRSRMTGGGGGGGNGGAGAGAGGEEKVGQEAGLRSPGTYYNTLREMTHSPARGYPVPGPHRSSHPPQRKSVPAIHVDDVDYDPYQTHNEGQNHNEGDKDSDMRTLTDLYEDEDSRSQYPTTPATPYSHSRPYSQFRPPSHMQSHANSHPAQRSRTTIYSQVTALPLEEDGEYGYGGSMYAGSGVLMPPQPAYAGSGAGRYGGGGAGAGAGSGRPSMVGGRSSGIGTESGLQGEDRWAYPQTPLAYVPVFKS